MSSIPVVSVCVPTYNGAVYLRECLDSVLAQSFSGYELLIVDDGSTDDTRAIAQAYAAKDRRVRVVNNRRNLGLVGNWNRCVKLARGTWIKFVFQDDFIRPRCLEHMLVAAHKSRLVACRRDFIFEEGTAEETRRFYLELLKVEDLFGEATRVTAEQCRNAALEHLALNFIGEPTVVMLHRRVFDELGHFNSNFVMICDAEYWMRIGVHHGFTYVPETLATFRVHGGAVSARMWAKRPYRITLDTIVLLHEFLFARTYEPLRSAAQQHDPPINLKEKLVYEVRLKRWMAAEAAHRDGKSDSTMLQEWRLLARAHPKLAKLVPSDAWSERTLVRRAVDRARRWIRETNRSA